MMGYDAPRSPPLDSRLRGNDVGRRGQPGRPAAPGIPRERRFACSRPLTLCEGGVLVLCGCCGEGWVCGFGCCFDFDANAFLLDGLG